MNEGKEKLKELLQELDDYPSPFFDVASFYMPADIKQCFLYCEYYFYNNHIISSGIKKLAVYPITDIHSQVSDPIQKAAQEDLFINKLKIKKILFEAGLNYWDYGNGFVLFIRPFRKYLLCPSCKKGELLSAIDEKRAKKMSLQWLNFSFQGTCPKCKKMVKFKLIDEEIQEPARAKFINLNPFNMTIKYNMITDETFYFYSIPKSIVDMVRKGDKDIITTLPEIFIQAIKENKTVRLNKNNIYHLKMPNITSRFAPWGFPTLFPAFKLLYHLQIMLKAREKLYKQHILPLWLLFPTANDGFPASQTTNLIEWRKKLDEEIKKWKRDPNYIVMLPFPVGFQFIGAEFKSLNIAPEIEQMEIAIAEALGLPLEFIRGGANWSGMGINLRLLQNTFINYRQDLNGLIEFMQDKISTTFNLKDIKIEMQELKLADDFQRKEMLYQLSGANKISDETFFKEIGLDRNFEYETLQNEAKQKEELNKVLAKIRAEIEGQIAMIQQQYQVRLQEEAIKQQERFSQQPRMIDPEAISNLMAGIIADYSKVDPNKANKIISSLQGTMPNLWGLVEGKMKSLKSKPLPEQKPPRREGEGGNV